MTVVDFYLGLGSRYSYLAASQVDRLEAAHGCRFAWKPITRAAEQIHRMTRHFRGSNRVEQQGRNAPGFCRTPQVVTYRMLWVGVRRDGVELRAHRYVIVFRVFDLRQMRSTSTPSFKKFGLCAGRPTDRGQQLDAFDYSHHAPIKIGKVCWNRF